MSCKNEAREAIEVALEAKKKELKRLFSKQMTILSHTHCPRQIVASLKKRRGSVVLEALRRYKKSLFFDLSDKENALPFIPVITHRLQNEFDLMDMIGGRVSYDPDKVSSDSVVYTFRSSGYQVSGLVDDGYAIIDIEQVPKILYFAFDIQIGEEFADIGGCNNAFDSFEKRKRMPLTSAELIALAVHLPKTLENFSAWGLGSLAGHLYSDGSGLTGKHRNFPTLELVKGTPIFSPKSDFYSYCATSSKKNFAFPSCAFRMYNCQTKRR